MIYCKDFNIGNSFRYDHTDFGIMFIKMKCLSYCGYL